MTEEAYLSRDAEVKLLKKRSDYWEEIGRGAEQAFNRGSKHAWELRQEEVDDLNKQAANRNAEVKALREALEFYADGNHYYVDEDSYGNLFDYVNDDGEYARAVLEKWK